MTVIVSLREIVEAMELPSEEWASYLDPDTGEIVTVTDEDRRLLEEAANVEELPDWQQESVTKAREVLESERFLPLPDQFEIHEWAIMERFARSRDNAQERERLLTAIHESGAFRKFRSSIRQLEMEEDWCAFRQAALEEIAKAWLEAHNIPYK
jgi:hypothetical protein